MLDFVLRKRVEKLTLLGYQHIKPKILTFKNSFHGEYGLGSICSSERKNYSFPFFETVSFQIPRVGYPLNGANLLVLKETEDFILKQFGLYLKNYSLSTAAMIIEPLQFFTGNILRNSFLKKLKEICEEFNLYLIFDEINLGVCRTGSFFYSDPIQSDFLLFSLGGLFEGLVTEYSINLNPPLDYQIHQANEIIKNIDYLRIAEISLYFSQGLRKLVAKYPKIATNVRSKGLMIFFDLNRKVYYDQFIAILKQEGVVLQQLSFPAFCFNFPIYLLDNEMDSILVKIEKSFKKLSLE